MTTEIVFSNIENKEKDPAKADFWRDCYHEDELTSDQKLNGKTWYKYHVKFDGLKPIQITKIEKI